MLSLQTLGLFADEQAQVERLLGFKEGIILVTGPTGSGKTTTLYSALRMIQSEGVNIVTVEDPVEFRLGKHIVQVQINEKAGLTFSTALRSILRQDPDVVLVGEIRDGETAQIAVQASLTGHLVLSTLHTNDAPNSVTRLVDMGMQAYKIGAALRGVIAQRLMRRLCLSCRVVQTDPVPERVARYFPAGAKLYQAKGCADCTMTGYRGRFSIVEILTMSPELERLIGQGATVDLIAAAARNNGMMSLFESGLRHVLEGDSLGGRAAAGHRYPAGGPVRRGRGARVGLQAVPSLYPTGVFPHGRRTRAGGPGRARRWTSPPPSSSSRTRRSTTLPATERSRGVSVLLVDDEDQLRRVMKDLLERDGYVVHEARDGVQALDQVDRVAPDIIVLDLNLPGLDGYAVLAQAALPPHHPGHPGRGPHRQGRRGQRGAGLRARGRRLPDQAVPGPRPLRAPRGGAQPASRRVTRRRRPAGHDPRPRLDDRSLRGAPCRGGARVPGAAPERPGAGRRARGRRSTATSRKGSGPRTARSARNAGGDRAHPRLACTT